MSWADAQSTRAEKFLASQAIQHVLRGVPATYIHILLGSRNWLREVKQTSRARTINRERLNAEAVVSALNDASSFWAKVFFPYINLIKTRGEQKAFQC